MKISMDKFRLTLFGMSLLTSFSYNAQVAIDKSNTRDGEEVEYCITHKKMHALQSTPGFAQQFAIDQSAMTQAEQQMQANPNATRQTYTIPVVFHVLHNNGNENISDAQIMDALFILNRDYSLQNADAALVHPEFQGLPANAEIKFVMATKAPNGNCFSGITRTQNILTSDGEDGGAQVNAIVNGNNVYNGQWAGNKYLNIFVVAHAGGAAGYTTLPSSWSANSMRNGIWILHNYTGSIGTGNVNTSRALTHEVGHWLNLSHTWGGNNNPGVSCGDDNVADTPVTKGVTSCLLNDMACGPRGNVENYMDYSYCSKMFTPGQVARMRAALQVSSTGRNNLWTSANLVSVGADGNLALCSAAFTANKTIICAGEEVQFTDNSFNVVSGWNWSFAGGLPATSSQQNPTVVFNTPGEYTITLTASDGSASDVETKTAYITVLPEGVSIPYYEGFESYTQTSQISDYFITSAANNSKWELTTTAGASGTKSLKLANFGQTGTDIDEFISSPFDLSGIDAATSVTLTFKYAYRKRVSTNNESLKVFITQNCGDSWEQRKTISGNSLSSQVSSTNWTPASAEDWTTVHMTNISSQFWKDNFRYKIRFDGNGGNNIFLDDINIYPGGPSDVIVLGIKEEANLVEGLNIYPNPAENELNVSFNAGSAKEMDFVITDLLGKTIQGQKIHAASGANLVMLSTEGMASGMYLLQIGADASRQVIQFMVK